MYNIYWKSISVIYRINVQRGFMIATRTCIRAACKILSKVHGLDRGIMPNVKPETKIKREGMPKPAPIPQPGPAVVPHMHIAPGM